MIPHHFFSLTLMPNDFLKTLPQFVVPKQLLTAFAGMMADVRLPFIKNHLITNFIAKYGVDMREAREEDPRHYACFNDFFIRRLKPACRPLADASIVSPVDGVISEMGSIEQGQLLQAKGHYYSVAELLACEPTGYQPFLQGRFATIYLSPKDYHRIHMPITATLKEMIYVPGKLFSVQPATARVVPKLFARNERLVVFFDTAIGPMAMVLVGATIVGAIGTSWQGDIKRQKQLKQVHYDHKTTLQQGEEMGYFKLGSTVIVLFADSKQMNWLPTLQAGSTVRYGEALGLSE